MAPPDATVPLALRKRATLFAAAISSRSRPNGLSMNLTPRTARFCWLMVFAFHAVNGLYALSLAYVYRNLAWPRMDYYVKLLQLMPQDNYKWIVALYACVSGLNFYSALKMIVYSLYYRRVAYDKIISAAVASETTASASHGRLHDAYAHARAWLRTCSWLQKPRQVAGFLRGFFAALSVRGQLFDAALLMRELVEIGSQAYQANSSSFLVSSMWINQLYGALLMLNCVANTAVYMLKREEVGVRRFLCTAIDLLLDFAWSSVLPTHIALAYLPTFIRYNYSFPAEFVYSETDFLRASLDFKQLLLVSWTDAVTTLLPYLNMFFGLRNLKILLHHETRGSAESVAASNSSAAASKSVPPKPGNPSKVAPEPCATDVTFQDSTDPLALASSDDSVVPFAARTTGPPSTDIHPRRSSEEYGQHGKTSCVAIAAHAALPLLGIFILLTSTYAGGVFRSHESCGSGCKLRMRPWFSNHCACAVMEISCVSEALEGSEVEMRQIFESLDVRVLSSLIISHCPKLTVPKEIRNFGMLANLEFYNVSLVQWRSDASLSLPFVPRLGNVFFERSHLISGIPEGLTHNLSPNIIDIEFIATEVGEIPEDLHIKWPNVVMLYFEHCGLREFPRTLATMALTDLSLVGNNISRLPDDVVWHHSWMYVFLDRNPIAALPEDLGDMSQLEMFTIQYTQITALPAWLDASERAGVRVYAYETPFCTEYWTPPPAGQAGARVCRSENKFSANGVFDLAVKDELRQLN